MACIVRLLRACSTFNLTHTLTLTDPIPALTQYLQTCNLEQVSATIDSLKQTKPTFNLAPLEYFLQSRLEQMQFSQVIGIKNAFKFIQTRKFGEKLESKAIDLLPSLNAEEVVQLLRAFAGKTPHFVRLLNQIERVLREKGTALPLEKKISALLSFYLSKHHPDQLLPLWSRSITTNLDQLSWSSLTHVLITYASVAGAHRDLFNQIENFALRSIPIMSPSDLALLCTAQTHVSAEFTAKLVPTLEEEIVSRASREEFTAYQLSDYCRGLTGILTRVGPALEPQIAAKVGDFSLSNLAAIMYHLGSNALANEQTWSLFTARMISEAKQANARTLSWALYGAFYRGNRHQVFYDTLGDEILLRKLTIKDVEKVIPVYSKLKRADILTHCRHKFLQSYSSLPPMRALTLINFFTEAHMMTPQLHQLLRSLKSPLP